MPLSSDGVTLDLRQGRTGNRSRQSAERSSRRHRADQAARRCDAAAGDRIPGGQGQHPAGQGLSRHLRADGRRLCGPRSVLARRPHLRTGDAMARPRAATSCSTSPAAHRSSRPPTCATAICALIRAIPPPCCARCSRRAISPAHSTSRVTLLLPRICARIRAPRSSAAAAASIFVRPARLRRMAIMWRSIRRFAPAAANAPPPARPARWPMPCRRPTPCCASCARCLAPTRKPAACKRW